MIESQLRLQMKNHASHRRSNINSLNQIKVLK